MAVPPVASCRCGVHYFPTSEDLRAYVDAKPGGFDWQERPRVGGASGVFVATFGAVHGHCMPDRNFATKNALYSVMRAAGYSVSAVAVPQDISTAALRRRYSVDVRVLDEHDQLSELARACD
ncbi:hypothetical protein [Mycobacterium shigaense]|uniref:hypothetical protein n=1 Tax=Mycobacterium shigaense TaxID=722731 RepID=UPI002AE03093|nr:hypothetical protein [Mycobacterium shigaense]MEA1123895.1 hypothetical protein [Mycobacterium shigaense]